MPKVLNYQIFSLTGIKILLPAIVIKVALVKNTLQLMNKIGD